MLSKILAVVCAVVAIVAIVLIVWIVDGMPAEQERFEQRQFQDCRDAYKRGGNDDVESDLMCAYITE